jgi:outer membrane protein assembly factor BamB
MKLPCTWILLAGCLLLANVSARAAYPQNPLLHNDSIYVSQQGIHRFQRNRRESLWSSLVGVETFAPVIADNLLLVGSTQGLYALDLESGKVTWHIEQQHTLFTPVASKKVYAGSVHGELYAIESADGGIVWRQPFSGWIYSPVIAEASNRLWAGGQAHQVYALSIDNGKLQKKIETSQESVFSPIDLGNGQIAFNLFDGNSLLLNPDSTSARESLPGDSQPTGIYAYGDRIYRSHRDGTLSAFDRPSRNLIWRRPLVSQDLVMHPAQSGYLLLSDGDRNLVLLDLEQDGTACRIQSDGQWLLPMQADTRNIISFRKSMQPPGLTLVQTGAQCK